MKEKKKITNKFCKVLIDNTPERYSWRELTEKVYKEFGIYCSTDFGHEIVLREGFHRDKGHPKSGGKKCFLYYYNDNFQHNKKQPIDILQENVNNINKEIRIVKAILYKICLKFGITINEG